MNKAKDAEARAKAAATKIVAVEMALTGYEGAVEAGTDAGGYVAAYVTLRNGLDVLIAQMDRRARVAEAAAANAPFMRGTTS